MSGMCRHLPSGPSLASRRGKNHIRPNHVMLLTFAFVSDGMASFSTTILSKTLVSLIRSATLAEPALVLSLVQSNSSFSISQALILSQSNIVTAARDLYQIQIGLNFCTSDGFQLPSHDLKPFLRSTASNIFMNLCFKGRQIYMTTITRCYDELITLIFASRL